jgi:hypothetical protein
MAQANASADATVAALQGAPPAPMPGAEAPSAPVAAPAAPAAATPAPMPGGAPPAALARVPGLLEQIDAGAAKAAEQAGKLVAAPPAEPGMVNTRGQTELAATPEQAAAGAQKMGEAQDAGATAAQKATQQAAVVDVNEYWQKRAAQQLAEQRYLAEKQATDAIQERVMKDYQATSEGELDPDRVFSGAPGTGWGLISTILGMVVGGAAAGPIGAVMMAVKGVDKAIRSDLERQKEVKNSRLAQYTDILGDQQLAYQRLYSQQLNLAAQQADVIAAEAKARGTMGNITALPDILRAQKAREEERFIKDHQTKRSLEYTNEMLLKKQGPAKPALSPLTAAENQILAEEGVDEKTWKDYRDLKADTNGAPLLESVATMRTTIDGMTGQDVKGLGPLDEKMALSRIFSSGDPKAAEVKQVMNWVNDNFARIKSGGAVTPVELDIMKQITEGRATLADLKRGLEIVERHGGARIKQFEKTTPRVKRAYDRIQGVQPQQGPTPREHGAPLPPPPPEAPSPVDDMLLGPGGEESKSEQKELRRTIREEGYGD